MLARHMDRDASYGRQLPGDIAVTCSGTRRFRTSEKFRVNAQKKRIDVWLVYRLRILRGELEFADPRTRRDGERYRKLSTLSGFMQNDEALARRYAFDLERLAASWRADRSVLRISLVSQGVCERMPATHA